MPHISRKAIVVGILATLLAQNRLTEVVHINKIGHQYKLLSKHVRSWNVNIIKEAANAEVLISVLDRRQRRSMWRLASSLRSQLKRQFHRELKRLRMEEITQSDFDEVICSLDYFIFVENQHLLQPPSKVFTLKQHKPIRFQSQATPSQNYLTLRKRNNNRGPPTPRKPPQYRPRRHTPRHRGGGAFPTSPSSRGLSPNIAPDEPNHPESASQPFAQSPSMHSPRNLFMVPSCSAPSSSPAPNFSIAGVNTPTRFIPEIELDEDEPEIGRGDTGGESSNMDIDLGINVEDCFGQLTTPPPPQRQVHFSISAGASDIGDESRPYIDTFTPSPATAPQMEEYTPATSCDGWKGTNATPSSSQWKVDDDGSNDSILKLVQTLQQENLTLSGKVTWYESQWNQAKEQASLWSAMCNRKMQKLEEIRKHVSSI